MSNREDTRPSQTKRRMKSIENKAVHVGAKVTPGAKLEAIDAALEALVGDADCAVDKARILDIRGRVVDVQHRMEQKAQPVPTMTDEETEVEAVKFLEGRGWTVTQGRVL